MSESHSLSARRVVKCGMLLLALAVAPMARAVTEEFSVDPQWTGTGNAAGGNNYGYSSATSYAGGNVGEVGGTFARVNTAENYYANIGIGTFTLENVISATGRFDLRNIVGWDTSGDSGMFIGHLSASTTDKTFIGLELKENDASSVRLRARFLLPGGSGGADSAFISVPVNGDYSFSYTYDPDLGANGRLTVSVGNATGYNQTLSVDLSSGERDSGVVFDAFGMGMEPSMNSENNPGKHIEVYLDDVEYICTDTPTTTASNNGPICPGQTLQLFATGGTGTFLWSGPNGFVSTQQNPTISNATTGAAGSYYVTRWVGGCASPTAITQASIGLPTATVNWGDLICIGGVATVRATLTGAAPWDLTWSDGFIQSGVTSNPATRLVSPPTNTTYSILSVADANCTGAASGSVTVVVRQLPSISSQPADATRCAGESVTFTVAVASNELAAMSSEVAGAAAQSDADIVKVAAVAAAPAQARFRTDRILVKPKRSVQLANLANRHAAVGAKAERVFNRIGNLQIVKLPPGLAVAQAIAHYRQSGLVEYAEPDYEQHALMSPNDPLYTEGYMWGLNNTGQNGGTADADIDAPEAWDVRTSADPVIVAVIDSGVRYTHEDLAANMWTNPGEIPGNGIDDDHNGYIDDVYGINAIPPDGNPWDDFFHGTAVAGVAGACGNNGVGAVGVAWNVRIMALKFISAEGSGWNSDAIMCIDYARRMGAKIMNNSWGGAPYSQALYDAIAATRDADIIFVAAAGNSDRDNDVSPFYPSSYGLDNIVAVTATDSNDNRAFAYGLTSVDLGAPGVNITTTYNSSDTAYYSSGSGGTSVSAPCVAGALALFRAEFPGLNYAAAISVLFASVDPLPALAGKVATGGRLNLRRMLTHYDVVTYQWRKDGVDIPGATNASFTISSVGVPAAGDYDAVIHNACGTTTSASATLTVLDCGAVAVTPAGGPDAAGEVGGPFSPASQIYTVTNTDIDPINWMTEVTGNWLSLSTGGGTLAAGASTNVVATITAAANGLVGGLYTNSVSFVDLTNGGNNYRVATLLVRDGISDQWREQYFGHIEPSANDHSRAEDDADGDGLNNLGEFLAGHDPTNSASAFRIRSVVREADDLRLTWQSAGGKTNLVQRVWNGGISPDYVDISGPIILPGSGDVITNHLDSGALTNFPASFYRIRLAP